jgi:hypothetical protein
VIDRAEVISLNKTGQNENKSQLEELCTRGWGNGPETMLVSHDLVISNNEED